MAAEMLLRTKSLGIYQHLPCGVSATYDAACDLVYHNAKAAEFLGLPDSNEYTSGRLEGLGFQIRQDGLPLVCGQLPLQMAIVTGQRVERRVLEFVWPSGRRKVGVWSAQPLINDDGVFAGAIATCEDITERIETEERLRRDREFLEQLLQKQAETLLAAFGTVDDILAGSPDGIFALDADLCIIFANIPRDMPDCDIFAKNGGRHLRECLPLAEELYEKILLASINRRAVRCTLSSAAFAGRCLDVNMYPAAKGRLIVYYRNLTLSHTSWGETSKLDRLIMANMG